MQFTCVNTGCWFSKSYGFYWKDYREKKMIGGLRSAKSLPFFSGRHSTSVFVYLLLWVWEQEERMPAAGVWRSRAALWSCCPSFTFLSALGVKGVKGIIWTRTRFKLRQCLKKDCWIPSPFSLLNPHWLDISPALVSECWELESGLPPPVSSFISLLILLWGFSNYVHVFF